MTRTRPDGIAGAGGTFGARSAVAVLAAAGLVASAPPAWFPGAEWLVLVGLGSFYALATSAGRVLGLGYLVGLVHMLAFSWSIRHVSWIGYVAIALVGAVYFVLAVVWTRGLRRWVPGPLAFGCAIAGTSWLRANMPEIQYPHAQPVHCLYAWPGLLLAPIRIGGEAFGNLLLAGVAAALVDLWRSWRSAERGARVAGAWVAGTAALGIAGGFWRGEAGEAAAAVPAAGSTAGSTGATGATLSVAVVEPGFEPAFQRQIDRDPELFHRHVVGPTLEHAGLRASRPPQLVVWPESAYPGILRVSGSAARLDAGEGLLGAFEQVVRLRLARGTRLLAGTIGEFSPRELRVVAVLLGEDGRLLTWWEKLALVPAGETIPFGNLLPGFVREAVVREIYRGLEDLPVVTVGVPRPPSPVGGIPVAAMLCYDNAFPAVSRDFVAAGARLLFVLSNESWYRRGAELEQMVAMTVLRALETATPLVRATVDGVSAAIDGSGRIVPATGSAAGGDGIARRALGDTSPRVLRYELRPGPERVGSLPRLHPAAVLAILATGVFLAAQLLWSWARLLAVRSRKDRSASSS